MKALRCLILFLFVFLILPFSANAYTVSMVIDNTLAGQVFGFDFFVSSDTPGSISPATEGPAIPDDWTTFLLSNGATGFTTATPDTALSTFSTIVSWVVADGASFSLTDWTLATTGNVEIPTTYTVQELVPALVQGNLCYTFTAVPIPPSVILLLSGMLGVVGFRKMKRK